MYKMFASHGDWALFFSLAVKSRKENCIDEAKKWIILYSQKNNLTIPEEDEIRYIIDEAHSWLSKFDENWADNLTHR